MIDVLTQEVLELFVSGVAASEIDKYLHLPNGTSHGIVVNWWRRWGEDEKNGHPAFGTAAAYGSS